MRWVRAFGRFWWDFVVGDEWRMAVIVAAATVLGGLAAASERVSGKAIACCVAAGVMVAACRVVIATTRPRAGLPPR